MYSWVMFNAYPINGFRLKVAEKEIVKKEKTKSLSWRKQSEYFSNSPLKTGLHSDCNPASE